MTWRAGLSSGPVTVPLILMRDLEDTTVPEVPSWMVMLVSPPSVLPLPDPPFEESASVTVGPAQTEENRPFVLEEHSPQATLIMIHVTRVVLIGFVPIARY